MRLVIASCTVDYVGRLSAHLAPAVRLIMVKADGSVSVHADGGAYKPLNWMTPPNTLHDHGSRWRVVNPKGEELLIELHQVIADVTHELGNDPGLEKDGVEAHLQELLAEHPDAIAAGTVLVRREYPTALGPVDLLCKSADGVTIAVEVKRRGEIDGVEQLARYLERLNADPALAPVRGVLAAQEIRPQARTLADARGIACLTLDYDALRGLEPSQLRLF